MLTFQIMYFIKGFQFILKTIIVILSVIVILFQIFFLIKSIIYRDYSGYVIIDEEGVQYISKKRKSNIKWNDISFVGYWDSRRNSINNYILFSKYTYKNVLTQTLGPKKISNEFIFVQYRKGLVNKIKKYWPYEIINENKYIHE